MTMRTIPSLCILAANGFGDAMVQMVLAYNLSKAGYAVTFFSDIASELSDLVTEYTIKPFPKKEKLLSELNSFDISLYDSSGKYVQTMSKQVENWCINNAICYRMSDAKPKHTSITIASLKKRLPIEHQKKATQLIKFNAALRTKYSLFYRPPVVQQLVSFLQNTIQLKQVSDHNGLIVGETSIHPKRIIIHPSSSSLSKNWPVEKYLGLIKLLQQKGFDPVITVAMNERAQWLTATKGIVDVPLFANLKELAEFYVSAQYFIGGDSGNAHLAAYLGLNTIQIFKGRKKQPAWRAAWGDNNVIIADFPFFLSKRKWQKGISINKVFCVFKKQIGKHN